MFDMTLFSPRGMMIGFRGHTSTQGFEQVLQNRDMTSEVAASQATGFGEIIKGPKWPKLWSTVNTRWRPPSFVCLLKKYRNYSTYTVPTIVYHKANSEILCRDARTNSRRFWSIPNEDAPVIPSPWGKSLWRTAPAKNPPSRAMVPFANHLSSKPATRQRRLGWLGWFGWLGWLAQSHNMCFSMLQSKQCISAVYEGFWCPTACQISAPSTRQWYRMAQQFENHPQVWQQRVQVTNATTSTAVWDHSILLSIYLVFTSRQCCTWISSDLDYVVLQESMGCNINQLLWVAQQCIVSQWAER